MLFGGSRYSMFWICSRTWSISTFSSTAAAELRASTDLEPSVLASRLNSCSRKSRRRPTASFSFSTRRASVDVRVEAVEFLLDVELLQPHHQFLLQPARLERLRQFGQARFQLDALAGADRRHQRAHFAPRSRAMPSTRSLITAASLAPSRSREATNSSSTSSSSASACSCSAAASADGRLQHAGELQQLGEIGMQARESAPPCPCASSLNSRRRVGSSCRPPPPSGARRRRVRSSLPRAMRAGDALAQHRFQRAQLVGQAHAELEEAVVDRAQLAAERAPGRGAFATGEGGHAADHAGESGAQCTGRRMVNLRLPMWQSRIGRMAMTARQTPALRW